MALTKEALQLNNEGIDFLNERIDEVRIRESISMLATALRSLKGALVQQEEPMRLEKTSQAWCQLVDSSKIDAIRCSEEGRPGASNYVVSRMFRLKPATSQEMPNEMQIYIACVIFNLALLHQIQASFVQPCHLQTSILERSLLLYKSCYQVLRNISITTTPPSDIPVCDFLFFIMIGALNNAAQILYQWDEYDQASEKLSVLESILYVQGSSESQSSFLTAQEYKGILSNVLLLKPPTVAVAA